ncbi:hypothetical protein [Streptomyces sp. NPDC056549]|uniref:hypothetical protein n=1 Tax=Streptomyces sp. NPDC056549 TaxID=3345864 RepID=UPI00368832D5
MYQHDGSPVVGVAPPTTLCNDAAADVSSPPAPVEGAVGRSRGSRPWITRQAGLSIFSFNVIPSHYLVDAINDLEGLKITGDLRHINA